MCPRARHARAQTLYPAGIDNLHCKTHIKLDLALERRVRGASPHQDILLITSIYAPQVAPCSNGACAACVSRTCRPYLVQKPIKLDLVLEPRVRGARPHPYLILFTSIYAPPIVACANGIRLPRIPDPRRPPAARASPRTNLRCETLRLDLPRALA